MLVLARAGQVVANVPRQLKPGLIVLASPYSPKRTLQTSLVPLFVSTVHQNHRPPPPPNLASSTNFPSRNHESRVVSPISESLSICVEAISPLTYLFI